MNSTPHTHVILPPSAETINAIRPASKIALKLDEPIPEFTARSTQGNISSEDYRGNWLILFSHPADFTPVCTSEFIALQNAINEFKKRNCALVGLSVDSIYSHIAWLESIKDHFGIEITFPVIEDISMSIAHAFGMVHEHSISTATVRSVFFIDESGKLRALIHYPMNVGRSVSEILRTLTALQETNGKDISAPEGWLPGDDMVASPAVSIDQSGVFAKNGSPMNTAWFYNKTVTPGISES